MKSLFIAIAITLALAGCIFGVCHWAGVADKVAGPLASATLALITFFHDKVDKALSASGASKITPGIVPIDRFTIHPKFMLLYVALLSAGQKELVSAVGMSIGSLFGMAGVYASVPFVGIAELAVMYLIARWVGIRSGKSGFWILAVGVAVGLGGDAVFTYLATKYSADESVMKVMTGGLSVTKFVALNAASIAINIAIGMVGVYSGNKLRFAAYFNSLLKQVSGETRQVLLSLAFDEARANPKPGAIAPAGILVPSPRTS